MVERLRSSEPLQLSNSMSLSHKILTREGHSPLSVTIPPETLASFQRGSMADRNAYWHEQQETLNFGQQMCRWMGMDAGKPGMVQWSTAQTDSDVITILQDVGLRGRNTNRSELLNDFRSSDAARLLTTINTSLAQANENQLEVNNMTDDQLRSLMFYAHYLTPKDQANPGKELDALIETIVKRANTLTNGSAAQTIDVLQKVTPLLQVTGERAQRAFGALLVARTYGLTWGQRLGNLNAINDPLTVQEQDVLLFLRENDNSSPTSSTVRRNAETSPNGTEILIELTEDGEMIPGEKYNVVDVLRRIQPPARKEEAISWIEQDIPQDIITTWEKKTASLRVTQPVWRKNGDMSEHNPSMFSWATSLERNERFNNVDDAIAGFDSYFALASVCAPTPEKQAALYKTFAQLILLTHTENTTLLKEFLTAQGTFSLGVMEDDENLKLGDVRYQSRRSIEEKLRQEGLTDIELSELSSEGLPADKKETIQRAVLDTAQEMRSAALHIDADEDRLLSLSLVLESLQVAPKVNIEQTTMDWLRRIKSLEAALQTVPLTLTVEQIRQIEFLGLSVDIPSLFRKGS